MNEQQCKALFALAGIGIHLQQRIPNEYWPETERYAEVRERSPWWLVTAVVVALAALLAFPTPEANAGENVRAEKPAPLPRVVWFGIVGISCMTLVQAMIFSFLEPAGLARGFDQPRHRLDELADSVGGALEAGALVIGQLDLDDLADTAALIQRAADGREAANQLAIIGLGEKGIGLLVAVLAPVHRAPALCVVLACDHLADRRGGFRSAAPGHHRNAEIAGLSPARDHGERHGVDLGPLAPATTAELSVWRRNKSSPPARVIRCSLRRFGSPSARRC